VNACGLGARQAAFCGWSTLSEQKWSSSGERRGVGVENAEREFHRGPTLVDLRLLKSELRRLKDVAFGAIREEEEERCGRARAERS
jgi:hypothetical protein